MVSVRVRVGLWVSVKASDGAVVSVRAGIVYLCLTDTDRVSDGAVCSASDVRWLWDVVMESVNGSDSNIASWYVWDVLMLSVNGNES